MQHSPLNTKPRSWARVLFSLFFGHPQVLVLVPLSIGLLVHAIVRLSHHEPTHGWSSGELLHCAGVITAMAIFVVISVWYTIMVIVGTLKRTGDGSNFMTSRITSDGHRVDCIVSHGYLLERIAEMAKSRRLIGPVARPTPEAGPQYFYEEINDLKDLALDFPYCVYGPKEALLPARETLLRFDREDGRFKADACIDDRPTALVGVHPCDLNAINMLDAAFQEGRTDPHYAARRKNMFLIGVDCAKPCTEGVFCGDIGSNHAREGFDVMLFPMGNQLKCTNRRSGGNGSQPPGPCYAVTFGTDAGRTWLTGGHEDNYFLPEGTDIEKFDAYLEEKDASFPRELDVAWSEVPEVLGQSYDSLLWSATAERCYSCGSCNLVCPTCYCFDIQDENDLPLGSGYRERTWDGCMLREFAAVAGGHNFREQSANRLRHRIFRKGTWIRQKTGHGGCVGCARCDRACTAKISIKQIINQLSEEAQNACC